MSIEARLSNISNMKNEGLRIFGVAARTGDQVVGGDMFHGDGSPGSGITFAKGAFDNFLENNDKKIPLLYNHKSHVPPYNTKDGVDLWMEGNNLNFAAELVDNPTNKAAVELAVHGRFSGSVCRNTNG